MTTSWFLLLLLKRILSYRETWDKYSKYFLDREKDRRVWFDAKVEPGIQVKKKFLDKVPYALLNQESLISIFWYSTLCAVWWSSCKLVIKRSLVQVRQYPNLLQEFVWHKNTQWLNPQSLGTNLGTEMIFKVPELGGLLEILWTGSCRCATM